MEQYGLFHQKLLEWYNQHGREFYWRTEDLSPFEFLLTELLLKRTKAETVNNHAREVLERLPSPLAVVELDRETLMEMLKPFGLYNRRSKNINNVCNELITDHGGEVPTSRDELLAINGVGQYTADAVRCFAYGQPVILLDTNTAVVAEHFFAVSPADDPRLDTKTRPALEPLLDFGDAKQINWALLDLGADIIAHKKGPDDYTIPKVSIDTVS